MTFAMTNAVGVGSSLGRPPLRRQVTTRAAQRPASVRSSDGARSDDVSAAAALERLVRASASLGALSVLLASGASAATQLDARISLPELTQVQTELPNAAPSDEDDMADSDVLYAASKEHGFISNLALGMMDAPSLRQVGDPISDAKGAAVDAAKGALTDSAKGAAGRSAKGAAVDAAKGAIQGQLKGASYALHSSVQSGMPVADFASISLEQGADTPGSAVGEAAKGAQNSAAKLQKDVLPGDPAASEEDAQTLSTKTNTGALASKAKGLFQGAVKQTSDSAPSSLPSGPSDADSAQGATVNPAASVDPNDALNGYFQDIADTFNPNKSKDFSANPLSSPPAKDIENTAAKAEGVVNTGIPDLSEAGATSDPTDALASTFQGIADTFNPTKSNAAANPKDVQDALSPEGVGNTASKAQGVAKSAIPDLSEAGATFNPEDPATPIFQNLADTLNPSKASKAADPKDVKDALSPEGVGNTAAKAQGIAKSAVPDLSEAGATSDPTDALASTFQGIADTFNPTKSNAAANPKDVKDALSPEGVGNTASKAQGVAKSAIPDLSEAGASSNPEDPTKPLFQDLADTFNPSKSSKAANPKDAKDALSPEGVGNTASKAQGLAKSAIPDLSEAGATSNPEDPTKSLFQDAADTFNPSKSNKAANPKDVKDALSPEGVRDTASKAKGVAKSGIPDLSEAGASTDPKDALASTFQGIADTFNPTKSNEAANPKDVKDALSPEGVGSTASKAQGVAKSAIPDLSAAQEAGATSNPEDPTTPIFQDIADTVNPNKASKAADPKDAKNALSPEGVGSTVAKIQGLAKSAIPDLSAAQEPGSTSNPEDPTKALFQDAADTFNPSKANKAANPKDAKDALSPEGVGSSLSKAQGVVKSGIPDLSAADTPLSVSSGKSGFNPFQIISDIINPKKVGISPKAPVTPQGVKASVTGDVAAAEPPAPASASGDGKSAPVNPLQGIADIFNPNKVTSKDIAVTGEGIANTSSDAPPATPRPDVGDLSSGFWDIENGDTLRKRQVDSIRSNAQFSPQKRDGEQNATPASPQEGVKSENDGSLVVGGRTDIAKQARGVEQSTLPGK